MAAVFFALLPQCERTRELRPLLAALGTACNLTVAYAAVLPFLPTREDEVPEVESLQTSGRLGVAAGFFAVQSWQAVRVARLGKKLGAKLCQHYVNTANYVNVGNWVVSFALVLVALELMLETREQDDEDSQVHQSLEEPLLPGSPATGLRQRRHLEATETRDNVHIV